MPNDDSIASPLEASPKAMSPTGSASREPLEEDSFAVPNSLPTQPQSNVLNDAVNPTPSFSEAPDISTPVLSAVPSTGPAAAADTSTSSSRPSSIFKRLLNADSDDDEEDFEEEEERRRKKMKMEQDEEKKCKERIENERREEEEEKKKRKKEEEEKRTVEELKEQQERKRKEEEEQRKNEDDERKKKEEEMREKVRKQESENEAAQRKRKPSDDDFSDCDIDDAFDDRLEENGSASAPVEKKLVARTPEVLAPTPTAREKEATNRLSKTLIWLFDRSFEIQPIVI